ncbi:LOW QUALITY PROTEIN: probable leucine-rich repeat receptor-like protein kinase At1g35710 [Amborella trichopoda]|uniref:LOW QUALITY PROTEIN: probable leucine-rich repeat receptor-like protein kinase At1g35710 n=1 Tax=Amborella trichopoda TaxID=13333 RepID=UPI0009BD6AF8|nr:LOW QUALITY PROTEIN: probable leucine-rich repeat receptor-like protein kinase At1g35710 [Amborella trichopoda]|eukprot:XP_020525973.1 LOW QUALITY PROTEIN: probable leucine-rich repeat receptor-like protein kinase At1g35710 [Amborella trichopoda]
MRMEVVLRSPFLMFIFPFNLGLLIQTFGYSKVELEDEAEALLNWKITLKYHSLGSWFLKTDNSTCHCSWIGVKLQLREPLKFLVGTLNQLNFFMLPSLTHLNLSYNDLEGKIPRSIGSLSNLSFLDLGANHFTGPMPEEIGNLTELRFVSLLSNFLTRSIPYQLGDLQKVQFLELGGNCLDPTDSSRFPGMESLVHLSLHDNSLKDFPTFVFQCSIPREIGFILGLRKVSLDENPLLGGPIPGPVGQLWAREELSLHKCGLTSTNPAHLFTNWTNITYLDLRIRNLSMLEYMDVSANHFTGSIPSSIEKLSMVRVLDLSVNSFMGLLPPETWNIVNLCTMTFRVETENKCHGNVKLSSLEHLDVSNNQFSGCIPENIGEVMPILSFLSASNNSISGTIPTSIGDMTSLQRETYISGDIPDIFRNFAAMTITEKMSYSTYDHYAPFDYSRIDIVEKGALRDYTKFLFLVTCIVLSSNSLTVKIPESLTKLIGLRVLNLSRNHLIREIPLNINRLRELESMDLSNSLLSGGIPMSMPDVASLGALNLSYNNFSGPIPYSGHMRLLHIMEIKIFVVRPPLPKKCDGDNKVPILNGEGHLRSSSPFPSFWMGMSMSMSMGFRMGFGCLFSVLAIKRKWKNAVLMVMDLIAETLITRLQRLFGKRKHR